METFENRMRELLPVKKEERWKRYEKEKGECVCPSCPTYNACAEKIGETLFCLLGMSFHCIRDDLGCICPGCPLYIEYGMTRKDYCMKGSEKELRWERELK